MKIILNPHDDVSPKKILHFSVLNIMCKSVFQIQGKYYPQPQLIDVCEYECED